MGVYPKLIRSLCQTRGLQTTSGPPSLFKWPAKGVQLFFHQNINTNKISKNSNCTFLLFMRSFFFFNFQLDGKINLVYLVYRNAVELTTLGTIFAASC